MDKTYLFLLPLIAVALIIIPFVLTLKRKKSGKPVNVKKSVLLNVCSFIGCMALMICVMPSFVSAEAAEAAGEAAEGIASGRGVTRRSRGYRSYQRGRKELHQVPYLRCAGRRRCHLRSAYFHTYFERLIFTP